MEASPEQKRKKPRTEEPPASSTAVATASPGDEEKVKALATVAEVVRRFSPALFASLAEFADDCLFAGCVGFSSEGAYLKHVECSVYVRAMLVNVACALYDSNCRSDKLEFETTSERSSGWEFFQRSTDKRTICQEDREALVQRRTVLSDLDAALIDARDARLAIMTARQPRLRRLAEKYGFPRASVNERLLEVLAVLGTAQSDAVRCALVEDDPARRAMQLCRLAKASELDVECFADAEREHIKENVIYAADENDTYVTPGGVPALRLSRIGARMLLGDQSLESEELLKTAGTQLETLLLEEGIKIMPSSELPSPKKNKRSLDSILPTKHNCDGLKTSLAALRETMDDEEHEEEEEEEDEEEVAVETQVQVITASSTSNGVVQAYPSDNELEFLGEIFEGIALHIRLATVKIKGAIKEQSGGASRSSCFFPTPDEGARAGARELKAKLRVHESKVATRCAATPSHAPRLLQLQRKLELDDWETRVVSLLVGRTLSPAIKSLMDGMESTGAVQRLDDTTTVGALLSIFCPESFREQVEHRRKFYKGARLIKKGVLRLARSRWHSSGSSDLTEQRVELDRRVLDFVVGLDTEINELVEGSELYTPKVDLADVVLPDRQKESLLQLCSAFEHLGPYARRTGLFENALPYGAGLIVLLCGPSGTGKTMTVHGVANKLNKRVLQVDFASLRGKQSSSSDDVDADLRGLFREAEMSDALLFFDECEALFRSRDSSGGADRLLRAMLQEIERHAGLVFLATNRPAELDEAMHRRISTVVEYSPPTAQQRKQIWATLLSRGNLKCDPTIDWDAIGVKYELSGGFIKNALLSALLFALDRDHTDPLLLESDIRKSCALQQRGAMHKHHSSLGEREQMKLANSAAAVDNLALSTTIRDKIARLVSFEAQRGVVFGAWGFGAEAAASVALVYGPRGAGKRTLCAALAANVATSLYKVNARDVMYCDATASQPPSEIAKRLNSVLDDARLTDSALLIDGFEYALSQPSNNESGMVDLSPQLARALGEISKFPGVVLLVAHTETPNAVRLAPDFLRHLSLALPVDKPDLKLRAEVWRKIVPKAAPLAADVDFNKLARHDLLPSSIRKAAFTAAAIASARAAADKSTPKPAACITQADFAAAALSEAKRLRGEHADAIDRLFV